MIICLFRRFSLSTSPWLSPTCPDGSTAPTQKPKSSTFFRSVEFSVTKMKSLSFPSRKWSVSNSAEALLAVICRGFFNFLFCFQAFLIMPKAAEVQHLFRVTPWRELFFKGRNLGFHVVTSSAPMTLVSFCYWHLFRKTEINFIVFANGNMSILVSCSLFSVSVL